MWTMITMDGSPRGRYSQGRAQMAKRPCLHCRGVGMPCEWQHDCTSAFRAAIQLDNCTCRHHRRDRNILQCCSLGKYEDDVPAEWLCWRAEGQGHAPSCGWWSAMHSSMGCQSHRVTPHHTQPRYVAPPTHAFTPHHLGNTSQPLTHPPLTQPGELLSPRITVDSSGC